VRLALLALLCAGCGMKYARADRPLLLPGDRCRLFTGADEWQYPMREVKPSGLEGLPEDVEKCLMAGVSVERTDDAARAALLEQRLKDLGWLDARVEGGAVVPGERYAFAALPEELTELELTGPFVQAKVLLAEERLSKRSRCRVELQRGAADAERHQVPLTLVPCGGGAAAH